MRKLLLALVSALALAAFGAAPAFAGSPHFVSNTVTATVSGNLGQTITVSGKEAGLGDEAQVQIQITATASCVNPGGNKPSAANKTTVSSTGTFPVQNGKAEFSLSATATFQPSCSPPMTIVWGPITVADLTNGISTTVTV